MSSHTLRSHLNLAVTFPFNCVTKRKCFSLKHNKEFNISCKSRVQNPKAHRCSRGSTCCKLWRGVTKTRTQTSWEILPFVLLAKSFPFTIPLQDKFFCVHIHIDFLESITISITLTQIFQHLKWHWTKRPTTDFYHTRHFVSLVSRTREPRIDGDATLAPIRCQGLSQQQWQTTSAASNSPSTFVAMRQKSRSNFQFGLENIHSSQTVTRLCWFLTRHVEVKYVRECPTGKVFYDRRIKHDRTQS